MNILVLGNGFDVWHGMPTKYTDFLDFLRVMHTQLANPNSCSMLRQAVDESYLCKEYEQFRDYFFQFSALGQQRFAEELLELMHNNCWLEFFLERKTKNGGWIDFEQEISRVIQSLEPSNLRQKENAIIRDRFVRFLVDFGFSWDPYNRAPSIDRLLKDLDGLIRCLEIYLCLCSEIVPIHKKLKCICELDVVDKVLSFNYTNTFQRVYADDFVCEPDYCYVHGEAKPEGSLNTNNMVLGVDEYLDQVERNKNLEFIRFKKYYQRIYKGTDYSYTSWLKEKGEKNIYIIGHSLDMTDQDVLRDMILQEKYNNTEVRVLTEVVNTTIFFHSRNSNAGQIEKLVRLLGYDALNALARGADRDRHISFLPLE